MLDLFCMFTDRKDFAGERKEVLEQCNHDHVVVLERLNAIVESQVRIRV